MISLKDRPLIPPSLIGRHKIDAIDLAQKGLAQRREGAKNFAGIKRIAENG